MKDDWTELLRKKLQESDFSKFNWIRPEQEHESYRDPEAQAVLEKWMTNPTLH